MNLKQTGLLLGTALTLIGNSHHSANAQLPPDFPTVNVTTYDTNAVGDGYIFLTVSESSTNVGPYVVIYRNDGTPVWFRREDGSGWAATADFKVLPNGLLHYSDSYHTLSWTGGAVVHHRILDESYSEKEVVSTGNGYLPETHEFQMLPNGNALLLSYYQSRMDLSRVATGAYPNALVAGAVLQEVDAQRQVVWQWRSWDYYTFATYYAVPLATGRLLTVRNPVIDSFHINSIDLDTDGNLLISNFMVDVQKINRRTGEVMWRIGGFGNQFTFVGVPTAQALTHFSAHSVQRLPNGNILLFCNADQQATRSSAVYEYRLDETNKVATLVWSHTPSTPWYSWHAGSAQRLPNGNTFIGWGGGGMVPGVGGLTNRPVPACTEVSPSGRVVFEMKFNDPLVASYRAFRFPYPPGPQGTNVILPELSVGNTYDFTGAGLSLTVNSGGGGYNALAVRREPYAPSYPVFNGKPPRILPVRLSLMHSGIPGGLNADIDFDIANLGISNPTNTTVYYRSTTGQGLFIAQPTGFNPVAGKLSIYAAELLPQGSDFGEFVFGYPDVAEVPYPPILNAVESYTGSGALEVIAPLRATTGAVYAVNQTLPVSLSWSPKGFAAFYELQVSTHSDFSSPTIELGYTTQAYYVVSNVIPSTRYYYRVRTSNDGGVSDWSAGSFLPTAPLLNMLAPNGGEAWRRGLAYFIQWTNNLPENVTIDLYKGGVFTKNLATNVVNAGAAKWTIPFTLAPGSDYSIRIASVTNSAMAARSDLPFSIVDAPVINTASLTRLPDGRVQFGLTAPGAAQASVWGTAILSPANWQSLGTVPLTNGSGTFVDTNAPAFPRRFYRVVVP